MAVLPHLAVHITAPDRRLLEVATALQPTAPVRLPVEVAMGDQLPVAQLSVMALLT